MLRLCFVFLLCGKVVFATNFGVLKTNEVNVRNGPGEEYQIVRKFTKAGLPLQIVHKLDNWYLVKDFEDETGWIRENTISLTRRKAMTLYDDVRVCRLPTSGTEKCNVVALLKQEVIVSVDHCGVRWCRVFVDRLTSGWVDRSKLWGV